MFVAFVASIVLSACGTKTDATDSQTLDVSSRDPIIMQMRNTFAGARIPASVADVKPGTYWNNCYTRSALRNDESVGSTAFLFQEVGPGVVRQMLRSTLSDFVVTPIGIVGKTQDGRIEAVIRIAQNGGLVIENTKDSSLFSGFDSEAAISNVERRASFYVMCEAVANAAH